MEYVSIDEMLTYVGEFGPFQWSILAIFFFLNAVPGFQVMIMPFAAIKPSWRCIHNSSICLFNGTFPSDDNRRCHMDRNEWTYMESSKFSLAVQFDLYCDREWIIELATSIYFIGYGFGAVILGWVADNYGRRTVIIPSHFFAILIGFASAFSPNVMLVVISQFTLGFLYPGIFVQTFILLSEVVGVRHKVLACQLMTLAFPAFLLIMDLQAYYLREWKLLFILCSAPSIVLLLFYRFVPESIRWLRLKGEIEKISTSFSVIARCNKKAVPENMEISHVCNGVLESWTNPIEIFRTKKLAIESSVQGYCWFAIQFVYLGIIYSASNLGGSIYRDFAILALADIPGYFLVIYLCERAGRRKTFICSALTGGVAYMAITIVPSNDNLGYITIALATIAKLFILISNMSLYQWTAEIYPTKVRAVGFGFAEVCGRIGSFLSPWVANGLHSVSKRVPVLVMGVVAVIAALLALLLPETRGRATVEYIEGISDVENDSNT